MRPPKCAPQEVRHLMPPQVRAREEFFRGVAPRLSIDHTTCEWCAFAFWSFSQQFTDVFAVPSPALTSTRNRAPGPSGGVRRSTRSSFGG